MSLEYPVLAELKESAAWFQKGNTVMATITNISRKLMKLNILSPMV